MDQSVHSLTHDSYTVACICPMEVELAAVEAMLDEIHPSLPSARDKNSYTLGRMGAHNIVIAVMPEIGNNPAASVAIQLLNDFKSIRFGLLVGIGGGIPAEDEDDIRLGDIVVSKPTTTFGGVVQFDRGKVHTDRRFERTGTLNKPPPVLSANVQKLQAQHKRMGNQISKYLSEMLKRYPAMKGEQYFYQGADHDLLFEATYSHQGGNSCRGCDRSKVIDRTPREMTSPRIHYGAIGSANLVVKDAVTREKLREDLGIICVEMEAAGLMDEFPCLVIRGICDYADSHKNKKWQPYAAATAAAYAKEFLSIIPAAEVVTAHTAGSVMGIAGAGLQNTIVKGGNVANVALQQIVHGGIHINQYRPDSDLYDKTQNDEFWHGDEKDKQHNILDWLTRNLDADRHGRLQTDHLDKRSGKTCQWVLESEQFENWAAGKKETLFCHGPPGVGKTILTSLVVQHLIQICETETPSKMAIGFLYCNYNQQDQQRPKYLLEILLRQFAKILPALPESVIALYRLYTKYGTMPSLDHIFKVLRAVLKLHTTNFIIIDALDECRPCNKEDTIELISMLFQLQADVGLNLFVTARTGTDVAKQFTQGAVSLKICAAEEDLRSYLSRSVRKLPSFVQDDIELRNDIVNTIVKTSGGMFLLAQLQLDSLVGKPTLGRLRNALQALPVDYTEAYKDTLDRIRSQREGLKRLALDILYWITFAKRELTMVELRHAVAVDIGSGGLDDGEISHTDSHTETILDACVGLAVFDKKGDVIRLVHQTTWEYLSSQQAQLDVDSGLLTRTCLTYLSFDVFDIEVQSAFKSKSELQRKYPFYTYAALNWGHHVRDEIAKPKHDRDIEEQVHKFLSSDTKLHNSVQIMFGGHFPRPIHRLHVAATFGLQDIVLQLLNENANIHATDDYGWTALHRAAENGRDEMVSLLIERGADVNAATASKDGFSPVPFHDIAALPFFKVTVQLMNDVLRRFTNVHVDIIGILKDSNFFLFDAFDNFLGLENESTGPIAAGSEGISGGTPLHAACANGHVNSVKVLLDHEARVNANCMGAGGFIGTALHEAVFSGQKDVAQMLLERKANPNAIGVLGRDGLLDGTPVHFAALLGYDRVVECLLMNGADIDAYMEGFLIEGTALSLATFMGHENVVRALLRHVPGPDVHAGIRGLLCGTAIHLAALMGQENIVRLLLEQKDINVNYCAKGREVGRTTVAAMLMKTLLPAFAEVFLPDFGTHLNLFRSSLLQLESTLQIGLTGTALHFATAAGSGAVIQLLLEAGADVETTDDDGLTSLHLAVLGGHSKVVQQLLDKNANINAEKKLHQAIYRQPQTLLGRLLLPLVEAGMGALHMAASNGDPKLVRDLLRSGADINAATISGRMATHVAAQRGSHEAIRLLLQHGASISGEGMEGWTALHEAASCGRITVVEVLVNEGFEINKNDVFGSTALHEAARNEQHSVVQYLLENGADINQMDSYGRSAMHMAVSNRNTLVARLLVRHGGVVALEDGRGWTPLHEAINNRNYEMVQFLLEKGANVNAKSESGYTALHVAARTAQLALAQLLLENGAEAAEKDNDGNTSTDMGLRLELLEGTHTALYLAVKDGNEDAVRWLLSKEVVIDAETAKRQTALHEAAGLGHERIAKLLMDSSADLNKADESGRTPLHYAVRNGHASVVRLFLESGTDINVDAEAKGRRTPLHEAAEQGRKALVRLLLDSKATLDKADASGRTPLYYAARCGHYPVVKFLLSRGANVDAKACEITPLRIAVFYAHDYIVGLLEPGQKALHVAVKGEPKVVIQRVLEKTSVDAVNSSGQTALHVAVELDKTDVVELLLNARANTTVRDNDGQTALDKAVSMGRKHIEDLFQTLRH